MSVFWPAALYTLPGANAPFQPTLSGTAAPKDFSSPFSTTAAAPCRRRTESPSTRTAKRPWVWIANRAAAGSLLQLQASATSAVSPAAAFGSLNAPIGAAVDPSGDIWTANSGDNT